MNNESWLEPSIVLRATDLHKSYFRGAPVKVLRGVDLDVRAGEFVSVVGSSGSGKSTLLHLLGTLDAPDEGTVTWKDRRIDNQSRRFRDRFRNEVVGYIFQFYHLLPELDALENVMLPALVRLSAWSYLFEREKIHARARDLLDQVGLSHRATHRPNQMSGGEMQRTAIARALMTRPELLLADEPTGNLDAHTGRAIVDLLYQLSRDHNVPVVLVTHDTSIAERADRVLRLHEGRLVDCGVFA